MGRVQIELVALLLAPDVKRRIALQQVEKDGWEVEVYSGLPHSLTRHLLRVKRLSEHVDTISDMLRVGCVMRPEEVHYGTFKPRTWTGRRLSLPVTLTYG